MERLSKLRESLGIAVEDEVSLERLRQDAIDKQGNIIRPDIQEWNNDLSQSIDYMIPFGGIVKDIQEFIIAQSIYPQPALAYAVSLAVIGTCIGRDIAYENIKGNMMFIGMADSGDGKDLPLKMARKILGSVDMGHRLEGKPASGAALFESLLEQPSMLMQIDEYGHFMNGLTGNGAPSFQREIVTTFTEAYTSGSDVLTGKRTKGNDPITITEPNINLIGMSTERQIFDGIKTSEVADGSLARYMLLFGNKHVEPVRLSNHGADVPTHIVSGLNALIDKYRKSVFICSQQIEPGAGFADLKWELMAKIRAITLKHKSGLGMFRPFYNRVIMRAVQASLLVDQCQSTEVLQWFFDKEIETLDVFIKKFKHLSSENEHEKQLKMLQAKVKEAGTNGISASELSRSIRQIRAAERNAMLNDMVENEVIYKRMESRKYSQKESAYFYWMK